MKKDIQILLDFLKIYSTTFSVSQITLMSEEEDSEMTKEINRITKKYRNK